MVVSSEVRSSAFIGGLVSGTTTKGSGNAGVPCVPLFAEEAPGFGISGLGEKHFYNPIGTTPNPRTFTSCQTGLLALRCNCSELALPSQILLTSRKVCSLWLSVPQSCPGLLVVG